LMQTGGQNLLPHQTAVIDAAALVRHIPAG
jgi:hypothetical protein